MADSFSKEQRIESLQWLIDLFETTPTRVNEGTGPDGTASARQEKEKEKKDHGEG